MKWMINLFALVVLKVHALSVSCPELKQQIYAADVIFVGQVTKRTFMDAPDASKLCYTQADGATCGARAAKVKIEILLKGSAMLASKETTVVSTGDACYCANVPFDIGEKYLIFAYNTDNTVSFTSLGGCSTQVHSPELEEKVRVLLQNDEN